MQTISYFTSIVFFNVSVAHASPSFEIKAEESLCPSFKKLSDHLKGPEGKQKFSVKISKNTMLSGELSVTNKGNGTVQVSNLLLRIFDQSDDGVVYQDQCLSANFKDTNKDGFLDLVVTGKALKTDEKPRDATSEEDINVIYEFVPGTKKFHRSSGPRIEYLELSMD